MANVPHTPVVHPATTRLTTASRCALDLAKREAREHGHRLVGLEHLLYGLVAQRYDVAAQVLKGVSLEHHEVRGKFPTKEAALSAWVTPRHTKAVDVVLDAALKEALSLGSNYIGTEHILIALAKAPEAQKLIGWVTTRDLVTLVYDKLGIKVKSHDLSGVKAALQKAADALQGALRAIEAVV